MRPTSRAASINGCLVVSRQAVVCPKTATDGPFRRRMATCLCSSTGSQPHRQTDDDRAAIVTPIGAYNAPILSDSVHFRVRSTALSLILGYYITVDAEILSGTPCLKGTRVPAHYIADMVANGDSASAILAAYPYLTEGQIHAAVAYARAFPEYARACGRPPWRTHQPLVSSNTSLDDL